MDPWKLPTSLDVNGKEYSIRSDFRVILDILSAMNDPDIFEPGMTEEEKDQEKVFTMLRILYADFDSMPPKDWQEASRKACEFIDCGIKNDGKPRPRTMDWEQDAPIIIPAVNKVNNAEVRATDYMHWWTFIGYYMEIGDCTFSTILDIRRKLRKHKKLEKWEREYYDENRELIDFKSAHLTDDEDEFIRQLMTRGARDG